MNHIFAVGQPLFHCGLRVRVHSPGPLAAPLPRQQRTHRVRSDNRALSHRLLIQISQNFAGPFEWNQRTHRVRVVLIEADSVSPI